MNIESPEVPLLPEVPLVPDVPLVPEEPSPPEAPFKFTNQVSYEPEPIIVFTSTTISPVDGL